MEEDQIRKGSSARKGFHRMKRLLLVVSALALMMPLVALAQETPKSGAMKQETPEGGESVREGGHRLGHGQRRWEDVCRQGQQELAGHQP